MEGRPRRNRHLFRGLQNEWGLQPMRCCEGENRTRAVPIVFIPLNRPTLSVISCRFTHTPTPGLRLPNQMIPEGSESSSTPTKGKDDGVLAGYRECAMEALNWLLNLGYAPGHPLIRSLAAHLTKKQAHLEKINLERFLINETFKNSMKEFEKDTDVDPEIMNSRYEIYSYQIQNDKEIQKALVDAVFKGCDLQYADYSP